MELLGRIFGHHAPREEAPPAPPSAELIELISRWRDQVDNRKDTETTTATGELLQTLANNPELLPFSSFKFVRDGNRIVMNLGGRAHKDIAREGGLQYVDDAGEVRRDLKQKNTLSVCLNSMSLHVYPNKKNRPETEQSKF